MSKRLVSIGLFLVSLAVIICIFIYPLIFFNRLDCQLFSKSHNVGKISFELDSDVDDIVTVKRIHSLIGSYYTEEIKNPSHILIVGDTGQEIYVSSGNSDDVKKAFASIKKISTLYSMINKQLECTITDDIYIEDNTDLYDNVSRIEYCNQLGNLTMVFDYLTGKIIWFNINTKNEYDFTGIDTKQLTKDWIEYLNLDIINDWYYSGDRIVSDKAHLALTCATDENGLTLEFSVN